MRKIRQRRQMNELRGAPRRFEAIARQDFKRLASQLRAIGGEQDVAVARRDFKRHEQQLLEIAFHPKRLAGSAMGERWRIKNDRVEFFATPREPWQHFQ